MLKRLLATALGALTGSLVGMSVYIRTFPGYVAQEDRERAYWVALSYTGVGSALASGVFLLATERLLKGKHRETLRFLEEQESDPTLSPDDLATIQLLKDQLRR